MGLAKACGSFDHKAAVNNRQRSTVNIDQLSCDYVSSRRHSLTTGHGSIELVAITITRPSPSPRPAAEVTSIPRRSQSAHPCIDSKRMPCRVPPELWRGAHLPVVDIEPVAE